MTKICKMTKLKKSIEIVIFGIIIATNHVTAHSIETAMDPRVRTSIVTNFDVLENELHKLAETAAMKDAHDQCDHLHQVNIDNPHGNFVLLTPETTDPKEWIKESSILSQTYNEASKANYQPEYLQHLHHPNGVQHLQTEQMEPLLARILQLLEHDDQHTISDMCDALAHNDEEKLRNSNLANVVDVVDATQIHGSEMDATLKHPPHHNCRKCFKCKKLKRQSMVGGKKYHHTLPIIVQIHRRPPPPAPATTATATTVSTPPPLSTYSSSKASVDIKNSPFDKGYIISIGNRPHLDKDLLQRIMHAVTNAV